MKKIFLFILLLLFIPLFVNAETCDMDKISIESIQLSSKSDNIDEKSQPVKEEIPYGKIRRPELQVGSLGR